MTNFFQFIFFIFFIIAIIIFGHNIFDYLKDTYTTPVKKNMYVSHLEKYQQLLQDIKQNKQLEEEKLKTRMSLSHLCKNLFKNTYK